METVTAATERCKRQVSAACAPPEPPFFPDPCEPDFIRLCVGEPTKGQICVNCLAVALAGQVEDGLISQAEANRELLFYRISLEASPFSPGLQVFMAASKPELATW